MLSSLSRRRYSSGAEVHGRTEKFYITLHQGQPKDSPATWVQDKGTGQALAHIRVNIRSFTGRGHTGKF